MIYLPKHKDDGLIGPYLLRVCTNSRDNEQGVPRSLFNACT